MNSTTPKNLRSMFDRIVCINLDRRPERWKQFQSRLSRCNWPFGPVTRFRAVDGSKVNQPEWLRCGNGAWGCLQSHLRILEDALMDEVESLLILEDDAIFPDDLAEQCRRFFQEVPGDWDAIMLGGQHLIQPERISDQVVAVNNGNRTHAHAFRGRYIGAAYRHLTDYVNHSRTPTHHVDHRLGALHMAGDYKIYAPNPWIVGQGEGFSDISGRELEDRFWKQPIEAGSFDAAKTNPEIVKQANDTPVVAVTGLYRGGCRAVMSALQCAGGHLGDAGEAFLEDEALRELCRTFIHEPTMQPVAETKGRVRLLRKWADKRRLEAAAAGSTFVAAKHSLLSLMIDDLLHAWRTDAKIILVQRDVQEATKALEEMPWPHFRGHERSAQQKIADEVERFAKNPHCLLVDYERLRTDRESELARIMDFIGVNSTEQQFGDAVNAIRPLSTNESEVWQDKHVRRDRSPVGA